MSKELPYFKFEPQAWENGNIQACSKAARGLFMDICSMYWSRLGELPYALAMQKHCNGNANEMQELIDKDILIVKDDVIIIEFLDEQLTEFIEIGKKRADAANKRWNAKAMQKQCKSNAIREDKIREDKIRGYISPEFSEIFNLWLTYKANRKEKYKDEKSIELAYKKLLTLCNNDPVMGKLIIEQSMANNWAGLFELKDNSLKPKVKTLTDAEIIELSKKY